MPPRISHRTSVVITIIYLPEISSAGWTWNKKNTSPTTKDSHTFLFVLGTLTHDANLKTASLAQRQPLQTLVPEVDYY